MDIPKNIINFSWKISDGVYILYYKYLEDFWFFIYYYYKCKLKIDYSNY